MYGEAWSEQDVARLLELYESGASKAEACDALGINYYRLSAKLRRLGIRMQDKRQWTDNEIKTLKSMAADNKTADEVAKVINRTTAAVTAFSRKIGVVLAVPQYTDRAPAQSNREWTEEDVSSLIWCLENHYSVESAADYLERSPSAVRNRMSILGLKLKDFK